MYKHINICQGVWKSPNSVPEHSWKKSSTWNPRTTRPKAPGHYLKFPERSEGPLIDNCPMKRVKIEKGSLFDLLFADILKIINEWVIIFK